MNLKKIVSVLIASLIVAFVVMPLAAAAVPAIVAVEAAAEVVPAATFVALEAATAKLSAALVVLSILVAGSLGLQIYQIILGRLWDAQGIVIAGQLESTAEPAPSTRKRKRASSEPLGPGLMPYSAPPPAKPRKKTVLTSSPVDPLPSPAETGKKRGRKAKAAPDKA